MSHPTQSPQSPRKLSRRQFLWTSASALALAACAAPVQPAAAPQAADDAAPDAEPLTITMHIHAGWEEAVPGMYVRRPQTFMEEHPNIRIEMVPIPGGEYDTK